MKTIKILVTIIILYNSVVSCKKNEKQTELDKVEVSQKIINNEFKEPKLNVEIEVNKQKVLGKFNYKSDSSFVIVPSRYSNKLIYIQKEVCDSFIKMAKSAKKDSISLIILSGTRSFNEQKTIWERKWKQNNIKDSIKNALHILKYSSMPSTSRHHWGTDIDINNLNNSYFDKGKGLKEYKWLKNNAHKFGFFQPYTSKKNERNGYSEEKWHWSFKPISEKYLIYYNNNITYDDIVGFLGSETAPAINVLSNYVNGIQK